MSFHSPVFHTADSDLCVIPADPENDPHSDALALNIGSADWERTQVSSAYAAALDLGTGFKLFISFDLTGATAYIYFLLLACLT